MLIIDPQEDFCNPNGALFVKGADADSVILARTIDRLSKKLDRIHVTLDSHHLFHIAHPLFWIYPDNGAHPGPFTIVKFENNKLVGMQLNIDGSIAYEKEITTTKPNLYQYAVSYVQALNKNARYALCIWPPHCLIGTPGHAIYEPVRKSLLAWEAEHVKIVNKVTKGSSWGTEHYSAVKADVPDPRDPTTQLNISLIETLKNADMIIISGQALSHCVANTITDIADNFGEENIAKFTLLVDTCSNVPGFEALGSKFIADMTARGMNVSKADDFLI